MFWVLKAPLYIRAYIHEHSANLQWTNKNIRYFKHLAYIIKEWLLQNISNLLDTLLDLLNPNIHKFDWTPIVGLEKKIKRVSNNK